MPSTSDLSTGIGSGVDYRRARSDRERWRSVPMAIGHFAAVGSASVPGMSRECPGRPFCPERSETDIGHARRFRQVAGATRNVEEFRRYRCKRRRPNGVGPDRRVRIDNAVDRRNDQWRVARPEGFEPPSERITVPDLGLHRWAQTFVDRRLERISRPDSLGGRGSIKVESELAWKCPIQAVLNNVHPIG